MAEESRPTWMRYGSAIAAITASTALRALLFHFFHGRFSFLAYFPAIVAVALFAGRGPGLLTVTLAISIAKFWPPSNPAPNSASPSDPLNLTLLTASGFLLVLICDHSRRAGRAAILARAAELEASRQLASVMACITGYFYVLDRNWRFTYLSAQTAKYFGKLPAEVMGKVYWDLFPAADASKLGRQFREAMATQVPAEFEALGVVDRDRWFEVRAYPSPEGISVHFHEVTVRKLIEQERDRLLNSERHARGEAERASRLKDEFLATLSHELRTPLNAILGYAQLLRAMPAPPDIADGISVIERNARAQAQIIEDLLDMSRIISGKLSIDVRPLNLVEVISSAMETVYPAARARGISIEANFPDAGAMVTGDANRLGQVAWNLLSNAIKFTPHGGRVRVALACARGHVELSVTDTGQGIRADFLPYVFDRFRQADASTTRRQGGLGLGLSIVKNLVELHGGSVRAESEGEGRGATFIVSLPTAGEPSDSGYLSRDGTARAGSGGRGDSFGLSGVRVLVVDDERDSLDLVRRLLEDCRAQVATADSADEAIRQLDAATPDVLICDIGMPGQDGYQLIRRVRGRSKESGGAVPAAALTAFAREDDRRRVLSAGYQVHIAKPVDAQRLLTAIAQLAGRE